MDYPSGKNNGNYDTFEIKLFYNLTFKNIFWPKHRMTLYDRFRPIDKEIHQLILSHLCYFALLWTKLMCILRSSIWIKTIHSTRRTFEILNTLSWTELMWLLSLAFANLIDVFFKVSSKAKSFATCNTYMIFYSIMNRADVSFKVVS